MAHENDKVLGRGQGPGVKAMPRAQTSKVNYHGGLTPAEFAVYAEEHYKTLGIDATLPKSAFDDSIISNGSKSKAAITIHDDDEEVEVTKDVNNSFAYKDLRVSGVTQVEEPHEVPQLKAKVMRNKNEIDLAKAKSAFIKAREDKDVAQMEITLAKNSESLVIKEMTKVKKEHEETVRKDQEVIARLRGKLSIAKSKLKAIAVIAKLTKDGCAESPFMQSVADNMDDILRKVTDNGSGGGNTGNSGSAVATPIGTVATPSRAVTTPARAITTPGRVIATPGRAVSFGSSNIPATTAAQLPAGPTIARPIRQVSGTGSVVRWINSGGRVNRTTGAPKRRNDLSNLTAQEGNIYVNGYYRSLPGHSHLTRN